MDSIITLRQRITIWIISGRWYLTAFIIALIIAGLTVFIFFLTGGITPSTYALPKVLFVFVAQNFTSELREEPSWRGFLLPCLQACFEGENAIIIRWNAVSAVRVGILERLKPSTRR